MNEDDIYTIQTRFKKKIRRMRRRAGDNPVLLSLDPIMVYGA